MSNFLAVATVTATLSRLVQSAVGADVPGATVTTIRPDSAGGTPATGVNIYLYQVTPNPSLRNVDLPARIDGRLVQRPIAAVDLHYLMTFYGNDVELEPQRLLGSVVRALHSRPILTRKMISDTVGSLGFLTDSDLADEVEAVKFVTSSFSLEEFTKLWSVFFQTPYRLSVSYQASVVLIEGDGTPQRALPVRSRGLYGKPFRQPIIDGVAAQGGRDLPIVAGATIVLRGEGLLGDITRIRVDGIEFTPQNVSDTQIAVPLTTPPFPAGTPQAGVRGVQVIHSVMIGTPPLAHPGVESNVVPFVLRPTITAVAATVAKVTVRVSPGIGKGQRVALLLNELTDTNPKAYVFAADRPAADTDTMEIPISGVRAGDYLVRVQVDGAESPLSVDTTPGSPTFDRYINPKVTIP